jgi:hypothetical protein
VVLDLFTRMKEIEGSDGGWNGADTIDVLGEWFTEFGVNVEADDVAAARSLRVPAWLASTLTAPTLDGPDLVIHMRTDSRSPLDHARCYLAALAVHRVHDLRGICPASRSVERGQLHGPDPQPRATEVETAVTRECHLPAVSRSNRPTLPGTGLISGVRHRRTPPSPELHMHVRAHRLCRQTLDPRQDRRLGRRAPGRTPNGLPLPCGHFPGERQQVQEKLARGTLQFRGWNVLRCRCGSLLSSASVRVLIPSDSLRSRTQRGDVGTVRREGRPLRGDGRSLGSRSPYQRKSRVAKPQPCSQL